MAWSAETRHSLHQTKGLQQVIRIAGYLFLVLLGAKALAEESGPQPPAEGQLEVYQQQLYREASSAFRQGDYAAAASLFEKADRADFDDPVVFYNLGVSYFRLGRYAEAEAAFATAASFEKLAPLSYYNLGLIARRQDDNREASGWFRQAGRHPQASTKLRTLSRQALASLPVVEIVRPELLAGTETRLSDFLRFSFNAGYGQDSNIFRAPGTSYVDLSQPGAPTIEPLVQAGSFVPVDADVEFRWAPYEHGHFSAHYDFDGRIYPKAEHKNANAFRNRFAIGGRVHIPKNNGYRYFSSFFAITRFDENYYDRTDGQDQLLGTTDISDRFRRTRFGPRIYYHRERGRIGYGMTAEAFINKYDNDFEEPLDYLDLTHEQYQLGAHLSFDVLAHTGLRLSYDRYRRDYTQRKAKSADGIRFTTNDNLQYDYNEARLKISQGLGRYLNLGLAYGYTMRKDNFEGYDDYNRHRGMGQLEFTSRRFSAETGLVYETFQFPNGYAFDLPSAGEKNLDRMFAFFEASYRIRQRYHIMFTAEMDVVNSSDPRSAYEKNQFALGVRWSL